jgi:hypothetical protein
MDYFIRSQYVNGDRNMLDKEIREWAETKLHHLYVKDEYLNAVLQDIKNKVTELNAKYPRVQKKLEMSTWSGNKDVVNIRISEVLQYVAYVVEKVYSPF